MGYVVLIILFAIVFIINSKLKDLNNSDTKAKSSNFKYARKDYIMTPYETEFFKRLERISGSKYYVFPQIHLSSLLLNKTSGKYYKAGYQRLRRYAVDYVLADRQTMVTQYAIELDDKTHDARNRNIWSYFYTKLEMR